MQALRYDRLILRYYEFVAALLFCKLNKEAKDWYKLVYHHSLRNRHR